jgi:hypothetical protein
MKECILIITPRGLRKVLPESNCIRFLSVRLCQDQVRILFEATGQPTSYGLGKEISQRGQEEDTHEPI